MLTEHLVGLKSKLENIYFISISVDFGALATLGVSNYRSPKSLPYKI